MNVLTLSELAQDILAAQKRSSSQFSKRAGFDLLNSRSTAPTERRKFAQRSGLAIAKAQCAHCQAKIEALRFHGVDLLLVPPGVQE